MFKNYIENKNTFKCDNALIMQTSAYIYICLLLIREDVTSKTCFKSVN